jgi:hypothetical protein
MAQVTVVIGLDGKIEFAVAQGEFSAAQVAINQTIEGMRAEGVEFSEVGEVERHRHDHAHEHAHVQANQ